MALRPDNSSTLLNKAETAFKNEDYATAYRICSELMKGKTASVVVYMQSISSLKLRENTKEFVDELIDDTLLFTVALDNFYVQSGEQNKNIVSYIHEIIFTLLTSLIANVQKNYPFKSPKRSFKNAFSGAQASISNLRKLKAYDFSKFNVSLPAKLIDFAEETAEKLIVHVTHSINITKDVTNNWLYEDETDDLFERIVNYKSIMNEMEAEQDAPEPDVSEINSKSDSTKNGALNQDDDEFALDKLDDINIAPPAEVKVNEDYKGESEKVTVSQVLGKTPEKSGKSNTMSLSGKTYVQQDTIAQGRAKEKSKDAFVMPEALDDFSGTQRASKRNPTKSNKKAQPLDILIGVLGILFIIAVAYIIMYFL